MKALVAGIAVFVFVWIIYWTGGGDFERGYNLAITVFASAIFACSAGWLVWDISELLTDGKIDK